jgi:hypothetical protein
VKANLATKQHGQKTILISTLLWIAGCAFAQKAEPLRISFRRGSTSTQVEGSLSGRQQAEYVLGAKHGQTLSLLLVSSPGELLEPRVYDPKNTELTMKRLGAQRWTVPLPEDGDYTLTVRRVSGQRALSSYKLTVAIR